MAEPHGVLIAAIVTKWAAEAALSAPFSALGGLDFQERKAGTSANPPAGTHFPYSVIFEADSDMAGFTCASEKTEHDIRLRIYDTAIEQCKTHADLVKAIFDSGSLSLTLAEGSLINHRPTGARYRQIDKSLAFVELGYFFRTRRDRVA